MDWTEYSGHSSKGGGPRQGHGGAGDGGDGGDLTLLLMSSASSPRAGQILHFVRHLGQDLRPHPTLTAHLSAADRPPFWASLGASSSVPELRFRCLLRRSRSCSSSSSRVHCLARLGDREAVSPWPATCGTGGHQRPPGGALCGWLWAVQKTIWKTILYVG